jgi:hypothetical protein
MYVKDDKQRMLKKFNISKDEVDEEYRNVNDNDVLIF